MRISRSVQRILKMVDGCLLLVDAPKGRCRKPLCALQCLESGLSPIVVINKIDRADARIAEVLDEVLELFLDSMRPKSNAISRDLHQCTHRNRHTDLSHPGTNLEPLFKMIFDKVPRLRLTGARFAASDHDLDYNDYVGRIGIGRISHGKIMSVIK